LTLGQDWPGALAYKSMSAPRANFLFNSLDELIENVRKGIEELNATIPAD
jgi:hypothetical protein